MSASCSAIPCGSPAKSCFVVQQQFWRYAGGAAPGIQAFPSGGVYHTACTLSQITKRFQYFPDASSHYGELQAVMETLTTKRHTHARAPGRSDGTHTPPTPGVQQRQFKLHKWLKDGDPLNSEQVLDMLDLGVDFEQTSIDLKLPRAVTGSTAKMW